MDLDATGLRAGLQKLPQEIFDQIYTLTFTAPPGIRDLANPSETRGRYPSDTIPQDVAPTSIDFGTNLLHVSRASRAKYASTYYGLGDFRFDYPIHQWHRRCVDETGERILVWTRLVPVEFEHLINSISVQGVAIKRPDRNVPRKHTVWYDIQKALRDSLRSTYGHCLLGRGN
ncbi:uncharacterized protein RCC_09860 [Ramularia collo-cygni]|uniref:Uncharacterized protein n=1 Tax=Ramularia collo-cygni TaxID=112498 RepID=A0A2D3V816_9PEZI|nr:uncharacterized protein RCC_09860 [Ramularia collo-cygni]CZT24143.1 uncharacterized protein RCC_09860 [Ramularia collo-cygni]